MSLKDTIRKTNFQFYFEHLKINFMNNKIQLTILHKYVYDIPKIPLFLISKLQFAVSCDGEVTSFKSRRILLWALSAVLVFMKLD